MRTAVFGLALLMSGAAFAQSDQPYAGDGIATAAWETEGTATADAAGTPNAEATAGVAVVQPSNADPERDARGIPVISAAATVPAGWNGVAGNAMGGPLLDPVTGEPVAAGAESYPACTATVTDRCLQTYEKGRKAR